MLKNFSDISDENLVQLYRDTNKMHYLGELFKRYSLMCFAISVKYLKNEAEAQDAVMNIFEKCLIDIKKFEITNFKSWLHSVVRNHCLSLIRNEHKNVMSTAFNLNDENSFMDFEKLLHQNEDSNDKEKKLKMLEDAINMLNDKQKSCIELFYLQKKSYEDICSITGLNNNEVKSYIQNGKRNLKNILTEKGIDLIVLAWAIANV